jgi:hypothetical protein
MTPGERRSDVLLSSEWSQAAHLHRAGGAEAVGGVGAHLHQQRVAAAGPAAEWSAAIAGRRAAGRAQSLRACAAPTLSRGPRA